MEGLVVESGVGYSLLLSGSKHSFAMDKLHAKILPLG